jgi:hypothetical protein
VRKWIQKRLLSKSKKVITSQLWIHVQMDVAHVAVAVAAVVTVVVVIVINFLIK